MRLGIRLASVFVLALPVLASGGSPAGAASAPPRSGNEVVYTDDSDGDGDYAVLLKDLDTRRTYTVLPEDNVHHWTYDDPELSPDGQRIALSTNKSSAGTQGIAVISRDGNPNSWKTITFPPQLADADVIDVSPAWDPDSRDLMFSRLTVRDDSITSALYTAPSTGAGQAAVHPVPGGDGAYGGDFDISGSRIVYNRISDQLRGTGPLYMQNIDGTNVVPLNVTGSDAAWSNDDLAIAYSAVTRADNTDGKDVRQIGLVTFGVSGPDLVPTGSRLLTATQPDQNRATAAEFPSWAPDGESVLYDFYGYAADGTPTDGDMWAVDRAGVRAGAVITDRGDQAESAIGGPRPTPVSSLAATTYTPVTPVRVLDTRSGIGAGRAKVPAGGTLKLQLRGVPTSAGAVPDTATAVILNVTVTNTTAATDIRVYPSGSAAPVVSNINARAHETVPNLVTATLGSDGAVILRNNSGSADLLADLAGWYTPDTTGNGIAVISPQRILDTRNGTGASQAKVGPGGTVDLKVTGTLATDGGGSVSIPDTATAVILNVTATGPTSSTDVRVYPTPTNDEVPVVSNLNLTTGQTAANLVTVAVGDGGRVRLRNASGSTDLIADIAGYYGKGEAGRFVPVTPTRFLDTRSGIGAAPITTPAGAFVDLHIAGMRGVPDSATGAFLNLTATGGTAGTDIRAYPSDASGVPTVSNLNVGAGGTRANAAVVKTSSDGHVRLRNNSGRINLISDLAGYITTG